MRYFKIMSVLGVFALAGVANAGSEVGRVQFQDSQYLSSSTTAGYTFFKITGVKTNAPSCALGNQEGEQWVIHNDWPAAKIQLSILYAASIARRDVTIVGKGTCDVWGSAETAYEVRLAE